MHVNSENAIYLINYIKKGPYLFTPTPSPIPEQSSPTRSPIPEQSSPTRSLSPHRGGEYLRGTMTPYRDGGRVTLISHKKSVVDRKMHYLCMLE